MLDHAIRLLVAGFAQLAFPDDTNAPTHSLKIRHGASVPFGILVDLLNQKSLLLSGHLKYRHSCLCQKQPCMKMAIFREGNTKSGRPGSPAPPSLYRNPLACNALRTNNSGLVSLPRMPDIIRLRVALSTTSVTRFINQAALRTVVCCASVPSTIMGCIARATACITGTTTELPNCL